ncbi:MAG: ribonuclease HI [Proteobacteria bacterium]|nr:ribonuclease HI [Pseudomonadota bacterium]MBU1712256.1 ribonuclease HI [Pseudomonadota bacterium]
MDKINISWKRKMFKGNKVWLALGPDEKPLTENGKVLMKYNKNQDYEYWVNEKNLEEIIPGASIELQGTKKIKDKASLKNRKEEDEKLVSDEDIPSDVIHIYTDGASSGNPGPSGIGVLLRFGKHEKELSRDIGIATNNIAELEAIKNALLELKTTKNPVRIYTDSSYAFGVLTLNWKAKKNEELIDSIKKLMRRFKDLKLIKIKGHAGQEGNERADFLANKAVKKTKQGRSLI